MKMNRDHYNRLTNAVNQVITDHPNALQEYKDKGLSMMRYRWDLYHMACSKDNYNLANEIYQYCNDDNIDTVLRKITNTN